MDKIKQEIQSRYEAASRVYKTKIPEKLKDEKYLSFLKKLGEGYIPTEVSKHILACPEDMQTGRAVDLFKLKNPAPRVYKAKYLLLPDTTYYACTFFPFYVEEDKSRPVKIYIFGGRGVLVYSHGAEVFTSIVDEVLLPYDLRKWDTDISQVYLKYKHTNATSGLGYSPEHVLKPSKLTTGQLVQLRRANPLPSKRQREQEEKKTYRYLAKKMQLTHSKNQ